MRSGAYVALFPKLQLIFKAFPDYGKVTLPQVTGTPTALWVVGVAVVLGIVVALLGKRGGQTTLTH